jgi:hypothetical protein
VLFAHFLKGFHQLAGLFLLARSKLHFLNDFCFHGFSFVLESCQAVHILHGPRGGLDIARPIVLSVLPFVFLKLYRIIEDPALAALKAYDSFKASYRSIKKRMVQNIME